MDMKENPFFFHKNKKASISTFVLASLLVVSIFSILIPFAHASHATVDIIVDSQDQQVPVGIIVTDPTALGNGSVEVSVTTTSDSVGITLTLPETSPGVFDDIDHSTLQPNLWLMNGDNKFPRETTISLTDVGSPDFFDPSTPDLLTIFSSTSGGLVIDPFDLVETGNSTAVFPGKLKFSSTGPPGVILMDANPGEIFHLADACGDQAHGQITPIPAHNTEGAIKALLGDTITVHYGDSAHFDTASVNGVQPGCGGSGGGLVISRIVLDFLGGSSGGDLSPPQLVLNKLNLSNLPLIGDVLNFIQNADSFTVIKPIDNPSIDFPISINGNGYLLTQYSNTIQTFQANTGEPVSFKMTLTDATGVEHIGFYTNIRGTQREIQDSNTYFIYNEGKPLEITDPAGFFSDVNFTESEDNGKYIANFNMTFAKPMNTSDVVIRTWDELRNSGDTKIFDAIKVQGDPIVNLDANDLIVSDSAKIVIPYYKMPFFEIPKANSDGNLIYHNSFGGLEEKQVQPYHEPTAYPDEIGKAERNDDGFYDSVDAEIMKSQIIIDKLIGNPFHESSDKIELIKFPYPSNVGKLDREDKLKQEEIKTKEELKAIEIFNRLYATNNVED